MKKSFKSTIYKRICLTLINFLLFPFVLGHFDDQYCACEFAVIKRNCTAFRTLGSNQWQIFNLDIPHSGQSVSVISPKHSTDWGSFDFPVFIDVFEKEQFTHPLRASIVEILALS